jgi:hypothetical protein
MGEYSERSVRGKIKRNGKGEYMNIGKIKRNGKEEYMNIQVGRCAWWKGDNGKGAK